MLPSMQSDLLASRASMLHGARVQSDSSVTIFSAALLDVVFQPPPPLDLGFYSVCLITKSGEALEVGLVQ